MPKERRWIILAEDGRHVTIGRHTDPTDEEIDRGGQQLGALGLGGWLAVLDGVYYGTGPVSVLMVREIAPPSRTWELAVVDFMSTRKRASEPGPSQ